VSLVILTVPPKMVQPPVAVMTTGLPEAPPVAATGKVEALGAVAGACVVTVMVWFCAIGAAATVSVPVLERAGLVLCTVKEVIAAGVAAVVVIVRVTLGGVLPPGPLLNVELKLPVAPLGSPVTERPDMLLLFVLSLVKEIVYAALPAVPAVRAPVCDPTLIAVTAAEATDGALIKRIERIASDTALKRAPDMKDDIYPG
jgi:hypothetical protein